MIDASSAGEESDDIKLRAARAERMARQALEGAAFAPGNLATLRQLTDVTKRPPLPRAPLPRDVVNHVPQTAFDLDEDVFNKNLRFSKKGAAPGPSGMTTDHLRPLLPDLLFQISERLALVLPEVPEC